MSSDHDRRERRKISRYLRLKRLVERGEATRHDEIQFEKIRRQASPDFLNRAHDRERRELAKR